MKKGLLFSILFTITMVVNAQTPVWIWSNATGGRSSSDAPISTVKDNAGNVYISGEFEGTVNIGGTSYTSAGVNDVFLSKYDAAGNHLWTSTFGGANNFMFAGGIAIDANNNVYIAGTFTFRLDVGGNIYFTNNFTKDIYLIKVSPSGGALWAKVMGGLGAEDAKCVTSSGTKVYVGGSYNQTFTVDAAVFPATTSNNINAFVLATDTGGTGIWAAHGGGVNTDQLNSISASASSVYIGGYIQGAATFGSLNISGSGSDNDMLLAKLDPSTGAFLWAKGTGAASTDQINSVGQDANDNVYCGGSFLATVSFGGGVTLAETGFPMGAYGDAFIAKYNPTGTCQWARKVGGNSDDIASNIAVAPNGSVYGIGYFRLAATASSTTTPTQSFTTVGGSDLFAVKYSPVGSLLWAIRGGTTTDDKGRCITLDDNGFCFLAGNFFNTLTLGTLPAINSNPSLFTAFIARLNGFSVGLNDITNSVQVNVYPNPTSDVVNFEMPKGTYINAVEIFNVAGQLMMNQNYNLPMQNASLNISELPSGNYKVRVIANEGYVVKSIQVK